DRVAAKLPHRHLKGHASSRRRLLKDHRKGFAGEQPISPAVLVGKPGLDHPAQRAAVELVDVEEVARRIGRRVAPLPQPRLARGASHAGHSRATWFITPSASSISRSPTISGGRMRSTLSPAVSVSSPFWRSFVTNSAAGTTQRMPSSKPAPRNSAKSFG